MNQFVPVGDEHNFSLPFILEPLESFKEHLLILTGVDNLMPLLNTVGTQHWNANLTFLTSQPFLEQNEQQLEAKGPSIEQTIAELIGQQTPFQRLDFTVGGVQSDSGIWLPTAPTFWHGPKDPVASFNNPQMALHHIFGDPSQPQSPYQENRSTVLSHLLKQFDSLAENLHGDDKALIQAHSDKVEQLHHRLSYLSSCNPPELALSENYNPAVDDNLTAPIMSDILIQALACDYTRVATLNFANGRGFGSEDHPFSWLWEENGGPIVNHSIYDTWHAMAHADYEPGMELVFRWYMDIFADFLNKLASREDADGDNLLESSMVVCLSEFSSGRHWNNNLPIVIAGNFGNIQMGRWINKMPMSAAQFQEEGDHVYSGVHMGQFYTSMLHAFGFDDEHFGYSGPISMPSSANLQMDSVPTGPIDLS